MLRKAFLILVLLTCAQVFAGPEDEDVVLRTYNLPASASDQAADEIEKTLPGVELMRVVEMGGGQVSEAVLPGLPSHDTLERLITDPRVGGHFDHEAHRAAAVDSPSVPEAQPRSDAVPATWNIRLVVARVLLNGSMAGALIILKDHVKETDIEWARVAANTIVHGSVNGMFQYHGGKVADFSYANWGSLSGGLPNFQWRLYGLLYHTFLKSYPKRVLLTFGSVSIYRLTDYFFTGKFEFSLETVVLVLMNIAAALPPSALGLEMKGLIGPPEAKGLPIRSNKAFNLQNFAVSVALAAGLAATSREMIQAFNVNGPVVWGLIYGTVAGGGLLWFYTNSRWTNPELEPARDLAYKGAVSMFGSACVDAVLSPIRWILRRRS